MELQSTCNEQPWTVCWRLNLKIIRQMVDCPQQCFRAPWIAVLDNNWAAGCTYHQLCQQCHHPPTSAWQRSESCNKRVVSRMQQQQQQQQHGTATVLP
jgi:hypothetical protein